MEGDNSRSGFAHIETIFLSTPSGWRATGTVAYVPYLTNMISIHALRVEGDGSREYYSMDRLQFLSTPSGWRATIRRQLAD